MVNTTSHRPLVGAVGASKSRANKTAGASIQRQQLGLSLIELLMVMAVSAILATSAVPSFAGLMQKVSVGAAVDDLYSSLRYVRSEAIARGSEVTICKARDGECNTAASWHEGWVAFIDLNGDGVYDDGSGIEDAELPLRISENAYERVTSTSDISDFLRFRPDGSSSTAANFTICGSDASLCKNLSVTIVGQTRFVN